MKNKKIIAALIISILIFAPLNIEARGFGHASHVSHSVHTSHSTSHTSSHISRSSSFKSSTKSTSVKSSMSKSKPTLKSKADSKSFSTKKTTSTTKVKNVNVTKIYKVKPHKTTIKVVRPTYYTHYSTRPVYYSHSMSFWDYYMISELFNRDKVTERDVARALEEKGYSDSEVKQILLDADKENKKIKKESFWNKALHMLWNLIKISIIISVLVVLLLYFKRKR